MRSLLGAIVVLGGMVGVLWVCGQDALRYTGRGPNGAPLEKR